MPPSACCCGCCPPPTSASECEASHGTERAGGRCVSTGSDAGRGKAVTQAVLCIVRTGVFPGPWASVGDGAGAQGFSPPQKSTCSSGHTSSSVIVIVIVIWGGVAECKVRRQGCVPDVEGQRRDRARPRFSSSLMLAVEGQAGLGGLVSGDQ